MIHTSTLLSCPDSPYLSNIVGKLSFVQLVNERQQRELEPVIELDRNSVNANCTFR